MSLVLVLHATTSLCGPGHHALLGSSGVGEAKSAVAAEAGSLESGLSDHCPVCDYLSLGALLAEVFTVLPARRIEIQARPTVPTRPILLAHRSVCPRAPPSFAASVLV